MSNMKYFAPTIGIVVSTDDPAQSGRLKIFCPQWDEIQEIPTTKTEIDEIKFAEYASPFIGQIKNIKSGPNSDTSYGPTGFGFWAIPKVGSHVIVQCINGDPNRRFWTHCVMPNPMANRGLPGGRDDNNSGPFTDSYEEYEPYLSNLKEAGLDKGDHYKSRGYERQVAQPLENKNGEEGYAKNPSGDGLDPQTYCMTTPGHHFISLQDSPEFCRVRIRTNAGHQLIFDDTNERIYLSTAKGKCWFEMDQDGHIHVYSKESMSFRTEGDFNIRSEKTINLDAKQDINIKSTQSINIGASININLNASSSILETAGSNVEILASGNIIETGSLIHLNGPSAKSANKPISAKIKPEHEPWDRPISKDTRNKYWSK